MVLHLSVILFTGEGVSASGPEGEGNVYAYGLGMCLRLVQRVSASGPVGGVSFWSAGVWVDTPPGQTSPNQTPFLARPSPTRHPAWPDLPSPQVLRDAVNKQAARIPLESILVISILDTIFWKFSQSIKSFSCMLYSFHGMDS